MQIVIDYTDGHKIMASPRPRAASRPGGFGQIYMPKQYLLHKAWLARQIEQQVKEQGIFAMFGREQALSVTLLFDFAMPKSWTKVQKQRRVGQAKISKPDIDNLIKTVLDTMNELVWHDDSQIVELHSSKMYSESEHDKLVIIVNKVD